MFGEIILVAGITLFSALIEKLLEEMGKEKQAGFLGLATKCGLGLYAVRQINSVVREASKVFM